MRAAKGLISKKYKLSGQKYKNEWDWTILEIHEFTVEKECERCKKKIPKHTCMAVVPTHNLKRISICGACAKECYEEFLADLALALQDREKFNLIQRL